MSSQQSNEQKQEKADAAQAEADRLAAEAKTMPEAEPGPMDRSRVSRVVVDEDGDGKADEQGPTTKLAVVEVLIERSNNEKIPAEVFAFEVPVLKRVHGDLAVTEGDHVYDVEYRGDANDLYRSLVRKYNSPQAGTPVQDVYRSAKELADEAGLSVGQAKLAPASANVDNRRTAKKAAAKKSAKK